MMWDFSGGASSGQGSPPYYAQQQQPQQQQVQHSRGLAPGPHFPTAPGGFGAYPSGSAPAPFMPIGAPGSDNIMVDRYSPNSRGPWVVPGGPSSAPIPRSPVAMIHVQTHHSSHQSHSHSHTHRHSHSHSHSHSPRPPQVIVQHSSAPPKPSKHRPQPDPVQYLRLGPNPSSSHDHHHFMYSKCTGKKKALCIGINYRGQPNQLFGCVNDARNVQRFLIKHGYKARDIVLLTDDAKDPRLLPTRANIIERMRELVRGAQTHDSLFFHYSGHGAQVKDRNGDEIDGYDEVIFPMDYKSTSYIVDDLMHTIMVKPLPTGCRLTAVFDSCHSGSVLDLPYLYSSDGRAKGSQVKSKWIDYKSTSADVISWSGCKDSQTSADTWEQGVATGAMSYAFMTSLHQNPKQTYQELLRSIRVILRKKYSQKPQLSSSHHIDTNLEFIF